MYETILMIQYIGIAILVAEMVFLYFQNPSKIQRDMFLLLISLLVTFVAYTMELKTLDMQGKLRMAILTYLGKPMIVFAMLMLILDYCRITLPKYVIAGIFFVQAFVSATALTTREHKMFYGGVCGKRERGTGKGCSL